MVFKVLAFIYFKVFCGLFWSFAKFRNRFESDQNYCNVCSGSLDAKEIARIDLAGYVSLLDSSFLGSVFYRLRFLFFWPWLRQSFLKYKYFITSKNDFLKYKKCQKCGSLNLVLKNNRSNRGGDDDIHYYSKIKDSYEKHNQYISRFSDFIINESSKNNFPNKKILDVGSGTGEIIYLIKRNGLDVVGVEPSVGQYKASMQFLDLDIENKFYEKSLFKKESFSLIYSFHSIEHFSDCSLFFESANYHLMQNGALYLSTPLAELAENYAKSKKNGFFSSKDEIIFCSSHVQLLSRKFIVEKASQNGFSVHKVMENESKKISKWGEKPFSCTFKFLKD
jgi:SAM-dependent methyltransferase